MPVVSGQTLAGEFTINGSGGLQDADSLPTATLVLNGDDNAASVTVTKKSTGRYKWTCTAPTLAFGDHVQLVRMATVDGISDARPVFEDVAAGTNLSTQLDALPTAAENADAVWDEAQSGHTTSGTFGKYLDAQVSAISGGGGGSGPTAAEIADAVWDEATADHTTTGTTGKAITDAQSAGDPWATALPGTYTDGQAGNIVGNLDDRTLIVSPIQATSNSPSFTTRNLPNILQGSRQSHAITVTDGSGTAIDLSGKTIRVVFWHVTDEGDADDPTDDTIEGDFQYDDATVGGDDNNIITFTHDEANTANCGNYVFAVWNITDLIVLMYGKQRILPAKVSV